MEKNNFLEKQVKMVEFIGSKKKKKQLKRAFSKLMSSEIVKIKMRISQVRY